MGDRDDRDKGDDPGGTEPPVTETPGEFPWAPAAGLERLGTGWTEDSDSTETATAVETADGRRDPEPYIPAGPEPRTRLGRRARWCKVDTGEQFELAARSHRWLTRGIDIMIILTIVSFIETLSDILLIERNFQTSRSFDIAVGLTLLAVLLIFLVFYEVVWVARRGHNFGKIMLGIRVVRIENAGMPGWGRALSRALIPAVWALWLLVPFAGPLLFLLLFAPIMWQPRRQGLHDKLTATIVVKTGTLSGTRRAVTGFVLAIAGLIDLMTWDEDRDRLIRVDAGLVEVASDFAAALVYGLSCWIGAIVFSRAALRQARQAHWTLGAFALAAVCTTLVTVVLFALDWRTVFSA